MTELREEFEGVCEAIKKQIKVALFGVIITGFALTIWLAQDLIANKMAALAISVFNLFITLLTLYLGAQSSASYTAHFLSAVAY